MNTTLMHHYRVTATTRIGFNPEHVETRPVWEGTDTDELSRKYPPSNIHGADPLFHHEIEDGLIRTDYRFEKWVEPGTSVKFDTGDDPIAYIALTKGHWVKIDDPRRRLTPVTALEQAIDAENRRDYPGDYMNDCDSCGYDPCQCQGDEYGVDCTKCDDYGCPKCDPHWCTKCNNDGCATCEPDNVCHGCAKYFDPQDEELDKDSGLCRNCVFDQAVKCTECEYNLPNGEDGLCTDCREYLAIPRCFDCKELHPDSAKTNDDICQNCADSWDDLYKSRFWWQRLLNKWKFWH